MATPTLELIRALRETADRLEDRTIHYQWTHQGSCNCGHLAQTITKLGKAEIHSWAIEKPGEWSEHMEDYCTTSNYKIDAVIATMLESGLTRADLTHLEKLSDPLVLNRFPKGERNLQYNNREDVIRYMNMFADMLEEELLAKIDISEEMAEILR